MSDLKLADSLVVLDTNVLIHLLRKDAIWDSIEDKYKLLARPERPILSSIVEGELRGLVTSWKWGEQKIAILESTLAELVRVSAGEGEIVRSYGALYARQNKIGRKIGENDLWIAATAAAIGGVVLTCDRDFLKLDQGTVRSVFIDPYTA